MTYDSDPTRWTDVPGEAPDILRSAFDACRREGPTDFQMRALALKLAVVGSGAAIAASTSVASAAHVGSAAGGIAVAGAGGAVSAAKVAAMSVALLGAAATGVVMVKRRVDDAHDAQPTARITQAPIERAAERPVPVLPENDPAQHVERIVPPEPQPQPASSDAARVERQRVREAAAHPASSDIETMGSTHERTSRSHRAHAEVSARSSETTDIERSARAQRRAERREARAERAARETTSGGVVATTRAASADEIALLRDARAALAAKPKLAFKLTEQHRETYPDGVFTQERDALAVEALLRAGDSDGARELAEEFVRRYPSSPHAHRFRETMNIQ